MLGPWGFEGAWPGVTKTGFKVLSVRCLYLCGYAC